MHGQFLLPAKTIAKNGNIYDDKYEILKPKLLNFSENHSNMNKSFLYISIKGNNK